MIQRGYAFLQSEAVQPYISGLAGRYNARAFASTDPIQLQPCHLVPPLASSVTSEPETTFNWSRQWYPVALERDTDPSAPARVTLLGQDLVLWKEPMQLGWHCFLDACPHRLAPLSEGRIDPKTNYLQCAYHGWSFASDGSCKAIPQADPHASHAAYTSKRSCATVFPCMAAEGMIWVWPDATAEGQAIAGQTSPCLMEGLDQQSMSHLVVSRDMPYGFDTLLENGIDPSHLPWAHHNIISNRNQAGHINVTVNHIAKSGFDSEPFYPSTPSSKSSSGASKSSRGLVSQSLHFRPPSLLFQTINLTNALNQIPLIPKKERLIYIVTYAIPVAPGKSRVIYRFTRNYFIPPWWLRWPPEWLEHLRILKVLDSDTIFLHGQERSLQRNRAREIDQAYYMPTAADGSVRALRRWLQHYGKPEWSMGQSDSLPPRESSRRKLLDRYDSHVRDCKVCSGAQRRIRSLRHAIGFLSVMAFYLGLLGQNVYTRLVGGFLTVLGIRGVLVVKEFEKRFHYMPWSHAHNH